MWKSNSETEAAILPGSIKEAIAQITARRQSLKEALQANLSALSSSEVLSIV